MISRFTIGLDIGGTRIKAGIVDETGRLSNEKNVSSSLENGYQDVISQIKRLVDELRGKCQEKPLGVGLAVAGLMDAQQQVVVDSPNCGVLIGHKLAEDVESATGLSTVMDNDANAMALGEGLSGAAQGSRHYIAFTIGTGIGGAVVSDGRLIRGVDGGGCELGHIPIDFEGPPCGCGSHGCIEAYIGRTGLRRYIEHNHPQFRNTGMKELAQTASDGDEDAQDVFYFLGKVLGIGSAGLVNIFNPELIIIGGGVANAWNLFIEPLTEELHHRAFASYLGSLEIRPARLGNWAGVVGVTALLR